MNDDTFEIDLSKELLFGYERFKLKGYPRPVRAVSNKVIAHFRRIIQAGEKLKPIVVEDNLEVNQEGEINKMGYKIVPVFAYWHHDRIIEDGGHNRAMAYLAENIPLPCRSLNEKDTRISHCPPLNFYPINQTLILPDSHFIDSEGYSLGLKRRKQVWEDERDYFERRGLGS